VNCYTERSLEIHHFSDTVHWQRDKVSENWNEIVEFLVE
jgi:hypothetical protein